MDTKQSINEEFAVVVEYVYDYCFIFTFLVRFY